MLFQKSVAKAVLTTTGLGVFLVGLSAPSRADLTFYTDPGAYQSALSNLGRQDETVDFNDPGLLDNGPTVTGEAESIQGSMREVRFQEEIGGGEDINSPSGGQARIEANDGGLNSLYITTHNPADNFTALTANPNLFTGDSGFARVTAFSDDGQWTYTLGSGQNFFGIVATNDQSFDAVLLEFFSDAAMTTPLDIQDVRQVRVEINAVPEPAFYQMAGLLGLGGIGLLRFRKKRAA